MSVFNPNELLYIKYCSRCFTTLNECRCRHQCDVSRRTSSDPTRIDLVAAELEALLTIPTSAVACAQAPSRWSWPAAEAAATGPMRLAADSPPGSDATAKAYGKHTSTNATHNNQVTKTNGECLSRPKCDQAWILRDQALPSKRPEAKRAGRGRSQRASTSTKADLVKSSPEAARPSRTWQERKVNQTKFELRNEGQYVVAN